MTASRKQFRADLKAELQGYITALGSTDDFFKYEPASYGGHSPIVFLRPGGAAHAHNTKVALNSEFFVEVHLLSLYADLKGGVYNEESATDVLDDMESQLSAGVLAKRVVANKWTDLSFSGRSTADPQDVGGELYLHEVITLRGRMY